MINKRASLLPFIAMALLLAAVFGLVWANSHFLSQNSNSDEFASGWAGARHWLMEGGSPYDEQVAQTAQQLAGPILPAVSPDQYAFTYPLFSMLVFGPFGGMDFPTARIAWMTFIEVCLMLAVILSLRVSGLKVSPWMFGFIMLAVFLWYSGMRTVVLGQMAVVVVVLLLFSLFLMQQKQDNGAGFVLALAMVKPEISLLTIFFIIVWSLSVRRTRVVTGFFAAFVSLLAISVALDPSWVGAWLRLLIGTNGQAGWYSSILSLAAYSLPGIKTPLNIILHGLVILLLLLEWARALKKDEMLFLWTACFTLVAANLISFRSQSSYAVMLILPLFFILRIWQERWGPRGNWFVWLLMLLVVVVPWLIIFTTLRASADGIIGEPLSLFTWLPLVCLFALLWTRWWAARSTRLPFDLMRERLG